MPAKSSSLNKRHLIFQISLIVVIILVAILTLLAKTYPYFPIDLTITRTIQQFRPFWFYQLMIVISSLGEPVQAAVVFLLVFIFLFRNRAKNGILLGVSTVGAVVLSEIVKLIVQRPRPSPMLIFQAVPELNRDSFPSGHVMFFIGFYGFLFFLIFTQIKKTALRLFSEIILLLLLGLIGVSRIYLGEHWFSDVLGAYLIGFLWLSFIIHVYRVWRK